jgi:hypothetical protein
MRVLLSVEQAAIPEVVLVEELEEVEAARRDPPPEDGHGVDDAALPPQSEQQHDETVPFQGTGALPKGAVGAAPKRKKRRKKKRPPKQIAGMSPTVWWGVGFAACFVLAVGGIIFAVQGEYVEDLTMVGIQLAISLPISLVILVISMVVSSHIAGGIDFGEVHTAIIKAVALLTLINLVNIIPGGIYFSFLIWLFGLMYLFNLDLWEGRFVVFINWTMNYLARLFLVAAILNAINHGHEGAGEGLLVSGGGMMGGMGSSDPEREEKRLAQLRVKAFEVIDRVGGTFQNDPESQGRRLLNGDAQAGPDRDMPVMTVNLAGKAITDQDVKFLVGIPELSFLILDNTQVTDKGVAKLADLHNLANLSLVGTKVTDKSLRALKQSRHLVMLNVAGTAVTPAGEKDLQSALPHLHIVRMAAAPPAAPPAPRAAPANAVPEQPQQPPPADDDG